ncbi:hypothetical protein [Parasitella parasitica]|uniref:Uncharacterized protein n=1 Tax=Parasitella parasitica TaxID=35722 RepID=A0A0B7NQI9_9FUNG|nr:hypothetical protein [Parasitella parasitica]
MRPAIQHNVGPHHLFNILRVFHTEKFDELQLQYFVVSSVDKAFDESGIQVYLLQKTFPEFSSFLDKKRYNGIRPFANYLSHVYSSTISALRPFKDQMISLLDDVVLIVNHMAKVNGVSTFSCLYTLLNEYEEIHLQVLCHSKKMESLSPQFLEMVENYRRLGMKLPEIFYTDNVVGDQRFLKGVISPLDKDAVPVARSNKKNFAQDITYLSTKSRFRMMRLLLSAMIANQLMKLIRCCMMN